MNRSVVNWIRERNTCTDAEKRIRNLLLANSGQRSTVSLEHLDTESLLVEVLKQINQERLTYLSGGDKKTSVKYDFRNYIPNETTSLFTSIKPALQQLLNDPFPVYDPNTVREYAIRVATVLVQYDQRAQPILTKLTNTRPFMDVVDDCYYKLAKCKDELETMRTRGDERLTMIRGEKDEVINKLNVELALCRSAKDEATIDLEECQRKLRDCEVNLEAVREELVQAQSQTALVESRDVAELRALLNQRVEEITLLRQDVTAKNDELQAMATLRQQLDEAIQNDAVLTDRLKSATDTNTKLQKLLQQSTDNLTECQTFLSKMQTRLNDLQTELDVLKQERDECEVQHKNCKSDLEEVRQALTNCRTERQSDVDEFEKELNEYRTNLENARAQLMECKSDLNTTQQEMDNVRNDLDAMRTLCNRQANESVREQTQITVELTEKARELERVVNTANAEIITLNDKIQELEDDLDRGRTEINTLNKTLSTERFQVRQCETELTLITQKYEQCLTSKEQQKYELDETINTLRIQLQTLQNEFTQLQIVRDKCENDYASCQNERQQLETSVQSYESALRDANEKYEECSATLSGIQLQRSVSENEHISNLEKQIRHISNLEKQIRSLEDSVEALTRQNDDLQKLLDENVATNNLTLAKLADCLNETDTISHNYNSLKLKLNLSEKQRADEIKERSAEQERDAKTIGNLKKNLKILEASLQQSKNAEANYLARAKADESALESALAEHLSKLNAIKNEYTEQIANLEMQHALKIEELKAAQSQYIDASHQLFEPIKTLLLGIVNATATHNNQDIAILTSLVVIEDLSAPTYLEYINNVLNYIVALHNASLQIIIEVGDVAVKKGITSLANFDRNILSSQTKRSAYLAQLRQILDEHKELVARSFTLEEEEQELLQQALTQEVALTPSEAFNPYTLGAAATNQALFNTATASQQYRAPSKVKRERITETTRITPYTPVTEMPKQEALLPQQIPRRVSLITLSTQASKTQQPLQSSSMQSSSMSGTQTTPPIPTFKTISPIEMAYQNALKTLSPQDQAIVENVDVHKLLQTTPEERESLEQGSRRSRVLEKQRHERQLQKTQQRLPQTMKERREKYRYPDISSSTVRERKKEATTKAEIEESSIIQTP
ncbi:PlxyGVORF38-like protein [Hyphantria cunea granulovirus]|uniref:PlxyGVORF38-like protein n=1 Tax=Hyphantria cunea granulovirus TaxID=307448 RepID=A0AAE6D0G6_9BBAC|nr:PlxyGVORF38-like protein [Hyphantria cunea granulovirus]QBQ01593.1 PlxyGVORF38-like protein [Hyphantria cunea granulovirus]